jgi:hypothetical protein
LVTVADAFQRHFSGHQICNDCLKLDFSFLKI